MEVTLFGLIWGLFLIILFFRNDVCGIITMALFSMVLQCNNVMVLGTTSIGVQVFTVFVALVRLLLLPRRKEEMKKSARELVKAPLIFFMYLIVNAIIIRGQFSQNWMNVMIIGIYAGFVYLLYRKRLSVGINEKMIEMLVDRIVVFVLVIGVIQYLACSGVPLLRPLLTTCIFNDTANMNVIFHGKPFMRVMYASFMEPSYFAGFMVGMFAMIALRKKASFKNIFLLSFIALAIVLSRSSVGYGGLAITLAILTLRFYGSNRIVRIMVPLAVISFLVVALFNYELLDQVLFSKSETASYRVRAKWNRLAWGCFLEHPLFGAGVAQARASSLFYTLLGEIGVIGFFLYIGIILKCTKQILKKDNPGNVVGSAFAVIAVWICQMIACPDINFAPLWLMLFVLALSYNVSERKPADGEKGAEA